jgi:hypothetical protein
MESTQIVNLYDLMAPLARAGSILCSARWIRSPGAEFEESEVAGSISEHELSLEATLRQPAHLVLPGGCLQ